MYRFISPTVMAALMALAIPAAALAQIPRQISYQGVVTDATGTPINGSHTLQIAIYDAPSAGAPLHNETFPVTLHDGVFNVLLGALTPFPSSLSFDRPYFVGVAVDGGGELTPRTAMVAAPYALSAANALLTLPYDGVTSADSVAFSVRASGFGGAGRFWITSEGSSNVALEVRNAGTGPGMLSTSNGNGVWGITSSISAAGVVGDNTGGGEAVVGKSRGGDGIGAVVGRNDSSGYGVRGFSTRTGIGVLGQAGVSGSTGIAGRFENRNPANGSNALEAVTNGSGWAATVTSSANGGTSRGLQVQTAQFSGGIALSVANGLVALSYDNAYAGGKLDDAVIVITTAGDRSLPVTDLPDGTQIWAVNNSGAPVTITNTTAGPLPIAIGRMQHFALIKGVSGTNWVPEQ
jgi:hypothetical protein